MNSCFKRIFTLALFTITLVSCQKNYVISDKQEILFQFDYENYAWGYQHNGFIINSEGDILSYNNPEEWNFPDNDLMLNKIQVEENFQKCIPTGKKIDKEELQKYTNYINNIASSKVTALKNVAADAGSLKYLCYQYSESTLTYKGYLIKMEGDFTCENLNYYSKKVVAWLHNISTGLATE